MPEAGSPPNGGTAQVGQRIDLDLMIHTGAYNVAGQQSYVTFDATRLQNVNANQTGCVLTSTVTADASIFDATLQNEVCNGPGSCIFRGVTYTPGQSSFASGALNNPSYNGPDFRVAHVAFCAIASGTAVIRWDFSPPAPITRDSEVVDENSITVSNPNCYVDYVITIVCPPGSPTVTPTTTSTNTACRHQHQHQHPDEHEY